MSARVVRLTLPDGKRYDIRIGAGVTASLGEHVAAATKSRTLMRRRAAELEIEVIEWGDLQLERLVQRLNLWK